VVDAEGMMASRWCWCADRTQRGKAKYSGAVHVRVSHGDAKACASRVIALLKGQEFSQIIAGVPEYAADTPEQSIRYDKSSHKAPAGALFGSGSVAARLSRWRG